LLTGRDIHTRAANPHNNEAAVDRL